MSEFVEQCRREWKRLRVPDAVANEMAADLEADLAEAEAEGASAEDVLGTSAFDPTSFAASWAAERGVIHSAPADVAGRSKRLSIFVAIAASLSVALIGAAVTMLAAPSDSARVALAPPFAFRASPVAVFRAFGPGHVPVRPYFHPVQIPAPRLVPRAAAVRSVAVRLSVGGSHLHTTGLILLIVGIAGLLASLLSWSRWAAPSYR